MSSHQSAACKGKKKALLIAVRKVEGIDVPLPQTHYDAEELKKLLIDQYDYAEDDIVILMDDNKLHEPSWPTKHNILKRIKWLVQDVGEHDRLVFYYSGHGSQTTCRHGTEVDGKDELIYGYTGHPIIDNVLERQLVEPVLKKKGCQLFALFDCCHSETILDLKHRNCCSLLPPLVKSLITSVHTSCVDVAQIHVPNKWLRFSSEYRIALPVSIARHSKNVRFISPWSVIGLANRTLRHLRDRIARTLKDLLKSTPSSVCEPVQTMPVKPSVSVNTALPSQSDLLISPHWDVTSPTSILPIARCNSACIMTEEEENQGHVVCLSACRDSELAHDDNVTGGTLTKFFISSIRENSGISYRSLLRNIQSQVTDLQAKMAAASESNISSIRTRGCTQEPRINSNRPFDFENRLSI